MKRRAKVAKTPAAARKRRPRRGAPRGGLLVVTAGLLAVSLCIAVVGMVWAEFDGPGNGARVEILVPADPSRRALSDLLARHGLVTSPRLFAAYLALLRPGVRAKPGPHLLRDDLGPRELVAWLGRGPGRPRAKIVIPEGFQRFQIAERLDAAGVCARTTFLDATESRALLAELSIDGASAEGFLFPATHQLALNSHPEDVVRRLASETRKRLAALSVATGGGLERLRRSRSWSEREILTLASMVEKEAADPAERATIAAVFFNRLDSASFLPRRMLQSDPTAAYGCLAVRPRPVKCPSVPGKVTPTMLRDATNPYNTYKHAGLPPGPIANPGIDSIRAVIEPAKIDHFYFVATGDGRHVFSRTLEEHEAATSREAGRDR